jgi:hypothetical protein
LTFAAESTDRFRREGLLRSAGRGMPSVKEVEAFVFEVGFFGAQNIYGKPMFYFSESPRPLPDSSMAKNAKQTFFKHCLPCLFLCFPLGTDAVSCGDGRDKRCRIVAAFDRNGVGLLLVDPGMGVGGSLGKVGQVPILEGKRIAPLIAVLVDFAKRGVVKIACRAVIRPNRSNYPAITDFMHGLVIG